MICCSGAEILSPGSTPQTMGSVRGENLSAEQVQCRVFSSVQFGSVVLWHSEQVVCSVNLCITCPPVTNSDDDFLLLFTVLSVAFGSLKAVRSSSEVVIFAVFKSRPV